MMMKNRVWLSVDTDDFQFLPSVQGHKSRSKGKSIDLAKYHPSETLIQGFAGFCLWMKTNDFPVTIFVISSQLENEKFRTLLSDIIEEFPDRITLGCHGYDHRSWSSFEPDVEKFSAMLEKSNQLMTNFDSSRYRKWFRAPSGYFASWMAEPLKKAGFVVDSSINPSFIMNYKYGEANHKQALAAIDSSGLIERPWKCKNGLPVCGPALFKFPLSINSRIAWKNAGEIIPSNQVISEVESSNQIDTFYWHILDFSRKNGTWIPSL